MKNTNSRFLSCLKLMLGVVLILFTFIQEDNNASTGWTRTLEPVILSGHQVPSYLGFDVENVFAYTYKNGDWEQIPFQIDEINGNGDYVFEDGLLDDNDELVFMAMDVGEIAGQGSWISDSVSQNNPRYQITVINPLNTEETGFVYLYSSNTINKTYDAYVDWDDTEQLITAGSYKLGLGTLFQGIDHLELNGHGLDVLDRSKFRLAGVCRFSGNDFPFLYNEEMVPSELENFFQLSPEVYGPVRVGGGTQSYNNWFYHSLQIGEFSINFDYLKELICEIPGFNFGRFDSFRFSFDWLDPTENGMAPMVYYDANMTGGAAVDGVSEWVPISPLSSWMQVSGSHGSVVRATDISNNIIGSVENYYRDDLEADPFDTGDQQSFGDSGFVAVFSPDQTEYGQLEVKMTVYFLGPNLPNIGDTYSGYTNHPLQVEANSQEFLMAQYFPVLFGGAP
jgi:hypothetical protein